MPGKYVLTPLAERFWRHVKKADGCWLWTGKRLPFGHGEMSRGRRSAGNVKAHRLSWELHFGPIPDGMFVCHRCDTPACVRPDHLFLGTAQDNASDMVSKGRVVRRLTAVQVAEMRRLHDEGFSSRAIAVMYGIHHSAAWAVIARRSWKQVA